MDTEVTCKDLPEGINMENICLGCSPKSSI